MSTSIGQRGFEECGPRLGALALRHALLLPGEVRGHANAGHQLVNEINRISLVIEEVPGLHGRRWIDFSPCVAKNFSKVYLRIVIRGGGYNEFSDWGRN